MKKTMSEALSSLSVGKGGIPSKGFYLNDIACGHRGSMSIHFSETPDRDERKEYPYTLTLFVGGESPQKVGLTRADVFTKSKGHWARDCVWRLTPEAIARFAPQLAEIEKALT
jgi:hypothetical protein